MKKRDEQQPQQKTDTFRLAEALQMRRIERVVSAKQKVTFFECQLCLGRSDGVFTEIAHENYCPLNRL